MATSLKETVSVSQTTKNNYVSQPFHERAQQGNVLPIAYGGIALSQAISAGQATVPDPSFHLYSAQGTYLGPASTAVPTNFKVDEIRMTRSFCTRLVTASQTIDGKNRNVMVVLMDWHVKEDAVMLEYSNTPMFAMNEYSKPDHLPSQLDRVNSSLSEKVAKSYRSTFHLFFEFFDVHPCSTSKAAQNFYGWRKTATSQDHLPMTKRTSSAWFKVREKLKGGDHAAAMGFFTDGALAFLPLTFTDQPLPAAGACSSLDFSLRIFSPIDLNRWHLQEQHTECGGDARTFSIGTIWDESGKEIACMTQTSILRPKKAKL